MKNEKRGLITTSEEILHKIVHPVRVEFHVKDILQVIVGASILAIPVGYTEETWRLGEILPLANIIGFILLSLLFISAFTYYHYYHNNISKHWDHFIKRVLLTYLTSFLVVAILLSLIQRTPWTTNLFLAFKRTIIVAFPASMSGAIADVIK
ncbi:DUF2391 family protein [Candidatus Woesearchaeota archaeon]|nr:DUF2391 family protein [Candidatus Woesearchaeota archaeon]